MHTIVVSEIEFQPEKIGWVSISWKHMQNNKLTFLLLPPVIYNILPNRIEERHFNLTV